MLLVDPAVLHTTYLSDDDVWWCSIMLDHAWPCFFIDVQALLASLLESWCLFTATWPDPLQLVTSLVHRTLRELSERSIQPHPSLAQKNESVPVQQLGTDAMWSNDWKSWKTSLTYLYIDQCIYYVVRKTSDKTSQVVFDELCAFRAQLWYEAKCQWQTGCLKLYSQSTEL